MLRALELGISIQDMDMIDLCQLGDMLIERSNDDYDYNVIAGQDDFDKFRRV